ncbi:alpha-tubulin suppressor-like RCC1 family protein [Paenibacillus eucommiae]|uniref:Alpha-tubulin suppressor-like RCC1 family protein n=1 Tax=Paenibacillus eucommiae TaxID=1355755 RepID=A0ABS4IMV6_9BACL|nr:alpha-tubulin suppressor-like RCC1 family protein [Paenibacillus eucommiae]
MKKDGTVWGWGDNTDGQVGDGTVTTREVGSGKVLENNNRAEPVQIKGLSNIKEIAANFAASFALQEDGTLWGWGFISVPYTTTPVKFKGVKNIASIATGYSSNLLLAKKNGTVWTLESELKQVKGLANITTVAVSAGSMYALQDDGTVWAWGQNSSGQLGDGTHIDRKNPVKITTIKDVMALTANAGGPLYLKKDGTVWTNGSNLGGQLGIGSYESKNVPVQVKGLTHVKKISAAGTGYSAMALKEDGTLWSWGGGYVGDGTEWYRTVPTMIKSYDTQILQDINTIKVDLDGKALTFDQPPMLIAERTMVPLRTIFESMGADIEWNNATSTATAIKGQTEIKLTIGSDIAYVNGQTLKLDAPPVIIHERTLVPVRFIGESFGASVGWDEVTKTVVIKTGEPGS